MPSSFEADYPAITRWITWRGQAGARRWRDVKTAIPNRESPPGDGTLKYYDIIPPSSVDGWPELIEVRRVYCFDFYHHEPDPSELETLFAGLPGYRRDGRWFGESLSNPPCLSAVSDFNGLTVVGILRETDWRAWDRAFQERAAHLPMQRDEAEDASPPPATAR
jgi:hypothetical protein